MQLCMQVRISTSDKLIIISIQQAYESIAAKYESLMSRVVFGKHTIYSVSFYRIEPAR